MDVTRDGRNSRYGDKRPWGITVARTRGGKKKRADKGKGESACRVRGRKVGITFVQLGDGRRGGLELRPHLLRIELLLVVQLILVIGLGFERLDALLLPIAVPEVHNRIVLAPVVAHRYRSARSTHRCCPSATSRTHALPHTTRGAHHTHTHARKREREDEREEERERARVSERALVAKILRQSVRGTKARTRLAHPLVDTHARMYASTAITHTAPARLSFALESERAEASDDDDDDCDVNRNSLAFHPIRTNLLSHTRSRLSASPHVGLRLQIKSWTLRLRLACRGTLADINVRRMIIRYPRSPDRQRSAEGVGGTNWAVGTNLP